MKKRFNTKHLNSWLKEGAVVVPKFFERKEILPIAEDFKIIFPDGKASEEGLNKKKQGQIGNKLPL